MTARLGGRAGRGGVLAAVLAAVALSMAAPGRARASTASWSEHTYTAPGLPTRKYWLYVPNALAPGSPLVVFLHGCLQTALQAAAATRFNLLADQLGFAVVYPEQAVTPGSSAPLSDGNGSGCWNWFLPEDQQRDQGEPGTIAGITKEVILSQGIDPSRVYVEGVSAGADMAVVLGATYPDVYAAVAPLAGCAYATCSDTTGSVAYQAMGTRARVVPVFVAQGTADTLNAFPLGQGLVDAWLGTDDWADNGKADGSVARAPASVEQHGFDQTPQPGSGDPCVRASNWPCPGGVVGFQHTYPYTVEHFADANRCDVLDFWVIHGMEHALPSGPPDQPWTDPLGPDLTAASYRFFGQYTLKGGCPPT